MRPQEKNVNVTSKLFKFPQNKNGMQQFDERNQQNN